jgi:hypothetical protein
MIWEAKGNDVFCGLCEQFSVDLVHEVISGVPVFSCGVHKDLSCVHGVKVYKQAFFVNCGHVY